VTYSRGAIRRAASSEVWTGTNSNSTRSSQFAAAAGGTAPAGGTTPGPSYRGAAAAGTALRCSNSLRVSAAMKW